MSFHYIVYSSVPAGSLSEKDLELLLEVSRSENPGHQITGMLLCFESLFIQLIEGEEKQVRQLYSNIVKDRRHHRIESLREGSTAERFFPDWSMGYEKSTKKYDPATSSFDLLDPKALLLLDLLKA